MSSVVVEESIVCVNAQKDQAREMKKRDSYFLDRILFRVSIDQNKSVQEKATQQRTTLLIERVTAAACGFFFLFLFVHITNAREFNIYIIASGGGEGGGV